LEGKAELKRENLETGVRQKASLIIVYPENPDLPVVPGVADSYNAAALIVASQDLLAVTMDVNSWHAPVHSQMKRSVVRITFPVKSVDMMTVRSLKSVSGVVGVEMENGRLKDLLESASPEMKRSVVRKTFPVKTVDMMTVRSLKSVSGVV